MPYGHGTSDDTTLLPAEPALWRANGPGSLGIAVARTLWPMPDPSGMPA